MTLVEKHPKYDQKTATIKSSEERMKRFDVHDVAYNNQLNEIDFFSKY